MKLFSSRGAISLKPNGNATSRPSSISSEALRPENASSLVETSRTLAMYASAITIARPSAPKPRRSCVPALSGWVGVPGSAWTGTALPTGARSRACARSPSLRVRLKRKTAQKAAPSVPRAPTQAATSPQATVQLGVSANITIRLGVNCSAGVLRRHCHFLLPEANPLRNSTTSPSAITYSLPSMRTLPAARACAIDPAATRTSYETTSALMKPR